MRCVCRQTGKDPIQSITITNYYLFNVPSEKIILNISNQMRERETANWIHVVPNNDIKKPRHHLERNYINYIRSAQPNFTIVRLRSRMFICIQFSYLPLHLLLLNNLPDPVQHPWTSIDQNKLSLKIVSHEILQKFGWHWTWNNNNYIILTVFPP